MKGSYSTHNGEQIITDTWLCGAIVIIIYIYTLIFLGGR